MAATPDNPNFLQTIVHPTCVTILLAEPIKIEFRQVHQEPELKDNHQTQDFMASTVKTNTQFHLATDLVNHHQIEVAFLI